MDPSVAPKVPAQGTLPEAGDDSEPSLGRVIALSGLAFAVFAVVVAVVTA